MARPGWSQDTPSAAPSPVHITLRILGADCEDCPSNVQRAINSVVGVTRSRMRPGRRSGEIFAQVTFAEGTTSVEAITRTIADQTGHQAELSD